jgi:hypothetical protein
MNEATCACRCGCPRGPAQRCNGLCERCWLEWCQGSETHAPLANSSYMGTYGLGNIWTGWLISKAPELIAETPEALLRPEAARRCPSCGQQMSRRPGGWKCYRHEPPIVILEEVRLPRSPQIDVIGCLP